MAAREMMTLVCGGKVLAKEIADQIVDRTDGVPRRRRTRTWQFWARATDDHPWEGPVPPRLPTVRRRTRHRQGCPPAIGRLLRHLRVDGYAAYKALAARTKRLLTQ
jgi:transposase